MERIFVVSFNSESLPVELDGVSYLVDARQYGRTTVPALREQRDTSGEAGENALDTSGAWTRSQTDWTYGAGQTHFVHRVRFAVPRLPTAVDYCGNSHCKCSEENYLP